MATAPSTLDFLSKLDEVTYKEHPGSFRRKDEIGHKAGTGASLTAEGSGSGPIPPPVLNLYSLVSLRPALVCSLALLWQLVQDLVYVVMLAAGGMLSSSSRLRTGLLLVAVAGLTYRYLFNWQKGWLRQTVKEGVYYKRTARNQALVDKVDALQHPHYSNATLFFRDGDIRTLMPFLLFKPPKITYIRRWLKVPATDGPSKGFYRDEEGEGEVTTTATTTTTSPSSSSAAAVNVKANASVKHDVKSNGKVIGEEAGIPGVVEVDRQVELGDEERKGGESPLPIKGGSGDGGDDGGGGGDAVGLQEDEEAIALDWAFPSGGYEPSKGVVVVLHGLNGGSAESYVLDLVNEAIDRGVTVCVMVARGLMGTPVYGEALFHGARVTDVGTTGNMIRRLIGDGQPLSLVGYSMGGVIASNYVCKAGADCPLDCVVAIGGSFDTRVNMKFKHSIKVWQPFLAFELKQNFAVPNLSLLLKRGVDLVKLERAGNVVAFDTDMVAVYHGYKSVEDYYRDMSAGCDRKLDKLATPLLVVHAVDDPIMTVTSYPLHKAEENEHIIYLITDYGGHVGWPMGWRPTEKKWNWMTSTALDYIQAIHTVQ